MESPDLFMVLIGFVFAWFGYSKNIPIFNLASAGVFLWAVFASDEPILQEPLIMTSLIGVILWLMVTTFFNRS